MAVNFCRRNPEVALRHRYKSASFIVFVFSARATVVRTTKNRLHETLLFTLGSLLQADRGGVRDRGLAPQAGAQDGRGRGQAPGPAAHPDLAHEGDRDQEELADH